MWDKLTRSFKGWESFQKVVGHCPLVPRLFPSLMKNTKLYKIIRRTFPFSKNLKLNRNLEKKQFRTVTNNNEQSSTATNSDG